MRINESLIKKVKYMLIHYDECKSSDMYLAAMIWRYERGPDFGKATEYAFCGDLANENGLSHFTAIATARRKLQEEVPELRDKGYDKKKAFEAKFKKTIRTKSIEQIVQGNLFG